MDRDSRTARRAALRQKRSQLPLLKVPFQQLFNPLQPLELQDYHNLQKLVHMCNPLHFAGEQLIVPHDVPVSSRHLQRLLSSFTQTDKAVLEAAHGRVIPADAVNMARLVFGEPPPGEPIIGGIINT